MVAKRRFTHEQAQLLARLLQQASDEGLVGLPQHFLMDPFHPLTELMDDVKALLGARRCSEASVWEGVFEPELSAEAPAQEEEGG